MNNINFYINKYFEGMEEGVPIFSSDIRDFVLHKMPNANPIVINEYINRFERKNEYFSRFQKGIYFKSKNTVFGKTLINMSLLQKRLYLEDNGEIFGYETGPSLINRLGLTTQLPKYKYYATNKIRSKKISDSIQLIKPVIEVTKENFKYLQILDIISNKYKVNIEVDNYNEIIIEIMQKNNLTYEKLLFYSTFYNDNEIFRRIAFLTRKGE